MNNMRFTLAGNTTRQIGESYINTHGLSLGVILNKKCDASTEITEETPVWYDVSLHKFIQLGL